MNLRVCLLCGCLLWPANWLPAQFVPRDPVGENFFSPELVLRSREDIGLTKEQIAFLREQMRQVQGPLAELQNKLKRETQALSACAKKDHVDEPAILAQLDRVLNLERQIKRTQLELLVRIKNILTREQQTKLKTFKDRNSEWKEKLRKFNEAVQQLKKDGRELSSVASIRNEIEQLIRQEKFKEADKALQRGLKLLEEREKK